ncbi:MAG: RNA-directed DNA polymerase [Alphaproteobacteria bacterium]|nr:RNA-directed DNA polymerase [Alphaproteobacteria bacterium]
MRQVVYHQSQKHCIIKGKKSDWDKMPKSKSLFRVSEKKGLPIGNLTSQIFANFYLRDFDNFITASGVYYGRYVDDMVLMHTKKDILLRVKRKISLFLADHFHLQLHPAKSILQHCTKGFAFTGAFILPWRLYAGRRLRHAFWEVVKKIPHLKNVLNVLNSYFGFLRHYRTLRLRLKGWNLINMWIDKVYLNNQAVCIFCL